MKVTVMHISVHFVILLCSQFLCGQTPNTASSPGYGMNVLGETLTEEYYAIFLELPYDGIIDLELIEDGGKPIWNTHSVKKKGKHRVSINLGKLEYGKNYTVILGYKGKEEEHSFQVPGESFGSPAMVVHQPLH